MTTIKLWVRRPNSSPTRIKIPSAVSSPLSGPTSSGARDPRNIDIDLSEDFLVDDLREVILKKYPQSLGRYHDAADLSIRIPFRRPRDGEDDSVDTEMGRILSPDESVMRVLMEEYPDGQTASEAWTILTSGGRDSYTRWWLQTGGLNPEYLRTGISPSQLLPSTGGSLGSEVPPPEYFPYIPQTVITPPGEYPTRSRTSGSSLLSGGQYSRSQGRPSLRQNRSFTQEALTPSLRYNTNTSSLVVEPISGPESEASHQQGSSSNGLAVNLRYPLGVRPNSSISDRITPPSDFSNRPRQYAQSSKSGSIQSLTAIQSTKPQSPLGGPPNHRLTTAIPVSTSNMPVDISQQQTSPKSPPSASGSALPPAINHSTRRRSNTVTSQTGSVIQAPTSPSVAERIDSPRPGRGLPGILEKKKDSPSVSAPPKNSVIGNIPPINVLIVEDNIINAQILEVFFRKRKLKYAIAVNGKEAVEKWRQGGWHLVLMDIQLPVMSGIEATREIRRLERVNHIGVFSSSTRVSPSPEDALGDLPFPSPVIIVALTASSRESDRNEALAAGCNDFLTKPVGAPWLERKAIEWGCMQALIWTSFERKKRRGTQCNESGVEKVEVVEKPLVERGDSGDSGGSAQTKESNGESRDEGLR